MMNFKKDIIRLKEIDSTNNFANELISKNKSNIQKLNGTIITSEYQTNGRGQTTNFWASERSKNLLISLILTPDFINVKDQFILSKFFSLTILSLLQKLGIDAKIKWPNDIYAGNLKLGGILIENTISVNRIHTSVLGLGLNINQTSFSDKLPNPSSLKLLTGKDFQISEILEQLCIELETSYLKLSEKCFDYFDKTYIANLYRFNEVHLFIKNNISFKAKITGITEFGQLVIEKEEVNKIEVYNFKEIEFTL